MKASLALLALLPALAAGANHASTGMSMERNDFFTVPYQKRSEWTGQTFTQDFDGQFYVGTGRFAKLSGLSATAVPSASPVIGQTCGASVSVMLAYAELPSASSTMYDSHACTAAECAAGLEVAINAAQQHSRKCVPARQGQFEQSEGTQTDFCTTVGFTTGSQPAYVMSDDLTAVDTTNGIVFKASSTNLRRFFVKYNLDITGPAGCTATLDLSWTARTGMPEEGHCVAERDTRAFLERAGEEDPMFGNHTSESARLPRLARDTHVAKTAVVNNAKSYRSVLGKAPMLQVSCLDVYFTPYAASVADATCKNTQYGTAFDKTFKDNTLNEVHIAEYHDCSAFTMRNKEHPEYNIQMPNQYFQCCMQDTEDLCGRVNAFTPNTCTWINSEDKCVPNFESRSVNVQSLVGTGRELTLSSHYSNKGQSSYFPTVETLSLGFEADNNRLWVLEVRNNQAAGCHQAATMSYVVAPTAGLCEPSTRRMCDDAFEKCSYTMNPPAFFNTTEAKFFNWMLLNDGNYRTCNCLKRKEVCYRKNGCLGSSKYNDILENCDVADCGNWCDSASTAQLSLLAALVAAVALFM